MPLKCLLNKIVGYVCVVIEADNHHSVAEQHRCYRIDESFIKGPGAHPIQRIRNYRISPYKEKNYEESNCKRMQSDLYIYLCPLLQRIESSV